QQSDDLIEEVFVHGKLVSRARRATRCSWALAVLSEDPNDIKKKRANSESRSGRRESIKPGELSARFLLDSLLAGSPLTCLFINQPFDQHRSSQPPGVGEADVVDPALHRCVEFGKADFAGAVIGADPSLLRIVDHKMDIAPGPVAEVREFTMQFE